MLSHKREEDYNIRPRGGFALVIHRASSNGKGPRIKITNTIVQNRGARRAVEKTQRQGAFILNRNYAARGGERYANYGGRNLPRKKVRALMTGKLRQKGQTMRDERTGGTTPRKEKKAHCSRQKKKEAARVRRVLCFAQRRKNRDCEQSRVANRGGSRSRSEGSLAFYGPIRMSL